MAATVELRRGRRDIGRTETRTKYRGVQSRRPRRFNRGCCRPWSAARYTKSETAATRIATELRSTSARTRTEHQTPPFAGVLDGAFLSQGSGLQYEPPAEHQS